MKKINTKKIDIFFLSIKYWFQGDTWKEAKEFAIALVEGFKKR